MEYVKWCYVVYKSLPAFYLKCCWIDFFGLDCYIVIVGIFLNQAVGWDKGVISSLLRVCWQSSNIVQQIPMIHPASGSHVYLSPFPPSEFCER